MMAKGVATGYLQWGNERLEFEGAPAYAEKNWGGGFPKRWFWIQCEDFTDSPSTALTSVGAWGVLSATFRNTAVQGLIVVQGGTLVRVG